MRAVSTSVSGNQSDLSTRFSIVRSEIPSITSNLTITAANAAAYANQTVIVESGTVTMDVPLAVDRLLVLSNATVTHTAGGTRSVSVTATRGVFVA